jgi:hypothetical protein
MPETCVIVQSWAVLVCDSAGGQMTLVRKTTFGIVLVLALSFTSAHALSFENLKIIKLSEKDSTAVIKIDDQKLQLVKVGQTLGEFGKIVEIAQDRMVLDHPRKGSNERYIIRIENGKQLVQRISKTPSSDSLWRKPTEPTVSNQKE